MLAFFDDYAFGSHFTEFLTGQDHVGLAGQLLGFGIIDYEQAYFLDQSKQGFALDIDPKVDGVRQNEGSPFNWSSTCICRAGWIFPSSTYSESR